MAFGIPTLSQMGIPKKPTGGSIANHGSMSAQNRVVRQGDYIVTYSPSGAVLDRKYSPLGPSGGGRTDPYDPQANAIAQLQHRYQPTTTKSASTPTTRGLSAGNSNGGVSASSMAQNNPTTYGGSGIGGSGDVYGASSTGGSSSGNGGASQNADSGITYTGPFQGINEKQADFMVANPLAIASKVLGIDMARNPTIAGILGPVLEAAQNPYISATLNPHGTPDARNWDQNAELNFASNLLKQYTQPGGSFLSPVAGLRGIQAGMSDPKSALYALLATATGSGAGAVGSQLDLFQQIMAPFLSMGTGAWGDDIFKATAANAYNNYTLAQASQPNLPKQDFLSYLMGQFGYPSSFAAQSVPR